MGRLQDPLDPLVLAVTVFAFVVLAYGCMSQFPHYVVQWFSIDCHRSRA